MAWKITRAVCIENGTWIKSKQCMDDGDLCTEVGIGGPHGADITVKMPYKFRMRDDDGTIYYYGATDIDPNAGEDHEVFAPLDGFGTPNAGCITIEYKINNSWEAL